MPTFQPKSEEVIQQEREQREAERLLSNGVYDFQVKTGSDKKSKSGNDMIVLMMKFFGHNGEEVIVWEYLVFTDEMDWKVRHAADACGILDKYESGQLYGSDFDDLTGKAELKIQPAKDGYAAKNVVNDYVKRSVKAVAEAEPLDDAIPF